MDMMLTVLADILVLLFVSCLAITFPLIRRGAWPETRRGRTDAILSSLVVAVCAVILFVAGTMLPPGYTWCAMAIIPGVFYGMVVTRCVQADMRLTFLKAIGLCLQALVVAFAVMCLVAMTVGGQENAPPLSATLLFQELWIIAFMVGAIAPIVIDLKYAGKW